MPGHEQFEELCALAVSGQIPEEGWQILREHLKSCSSCAETLGAFGKIGTDLMAEFSRSVPNGRFAEMRSRFLDRARQAGNNVSSYPLPSPPLMRGWRVPSVVLSACAVAIILLILCAVFIETHKQVSLPNTDMVAQGIMKYAPTDRQTTSSDSKMQTPQGVLATEKALEQERDALQAKLSAALARERELETRVGVLNSQLDADGQQVAAAQSDRQATTLRLAHIQSALDEARSKQVAQEVHLASAQDEIDNLNQQLLYEKANSEREKALLVAGKDAPGIIAARNLHIIDVYDADGRGKRRSFGRVFYVEGHELVFYAYDLADPRHANSQFYAWGAGSVPGEAITRLGILHYDGQNDQRWVLKYDDASVLSKLDSIFVTAEVANNLQKPKGRRVLFAVLSGQPNHP